MIMAYSSVRVQFEIGHEASVRTKKTPEGFTHDWEVFVRGADNTDIKWFVDKVVFHLHETFPKPRRVPKLQLLQGVHVPNVAEALDLPMDPVLRLFQIYETSIDWSAMLPDPSRMSFRVRSWSIVPASPHHGSARAFSAAGMEILFACLETKTMEVRLSHETYCLAIAKFLVIKDPPYVVKESGYAGFVLPIDVYLKNKEEPKKISFQYDLTLQSSGPPISRVLREPRLFQNPSEDFRRKLIRGGGVGVDTPAEAPTDDLKSAPSMVPPNKAKPADSPAKKLKPDQPLNHSFAELFGTPIRRVPEPKKLPELSKKVDDKKKVSKPYKEEKEVSREKYSERDKGKEKMKRPPSPLPPPAKAKDEHKKHEEKEKKREEHEDKKKKREEKEKKEKTKEADRQLEKEHKREKKEGRNGDYAKKPNSKPSDPKANYEKHNNESTEKEKERLEKDKHKHRHKKKEKEKNREKDKHRKEREKDLRDLEKEREKCLKKKLEELREKEEKRRKSRSPSPVHFKKGPLNALLDELGSSDSASPLSEDESIPPAVKPLPKLPAKAVPDIKFQPVANVTTKLKSTNTMEPAVPTKPDENNITKNRKEKSSSKKSKKQDKDTEKKKEKEEMRARSMSSERMEKEDDKEEDKEKDRPNKEDRQEKEKPDDDKPKPKDKENRKRKWEKTDEKHTKPKKPPGLQPNSLQGLDGDAEDNRRPDKFTKEYVAQLKDLQHRIMTLEDNAELQKVVKVIAETGQYEVTKKTFDFDLCALDMDTVKRLQEFFAPT